MNYRSIANLNTAIINGLYRIPTDIDLIVGIPRSGMMAASIIALHRNLPFVDFQGFIEGKVYKAGSTCQVKTNDSFFSKCLKVLVIDDSLYHGYSIRNAKSEIKNAGITHTMLYGVIYLTPGKENEVDIYFEKVGHPRVFEWNIFRNSILLPNSCFDLDGVLCRDPTTEENDDGEMYLNFITNAEPLIVPRHEIGWIVTSRLEKYRKQTEEWLKLHNIKFRKLIMLNLPDKASRVSINCHATFKSSIYCKVPADLFVESSISQALEIAKTSKKNVLCIETSEMLQASLVNEYKMHFHYTSTALLKTTVYKLLKRLLRYINIFNKRAKGIL